MQRERACQTDLLLVAARKLACLLLRAGALDGELVDVLIRQRVDRLAVTPLDEPAQQVLEQFILRLHERERNVPFQRLIQQQTHAAPVLRHERERGAQARLGVVQRDLFTVKLDRAARVVQTHHAVWDAELALTGETADAEDLALAHVQIHVPDDLARHIDPQSADGHNGLCVRQLACLGDRRDIDLTTDHPLRDAVNIGFLCRDVLHDLAVAHDHDLVAHVQDLMQTVRNKDHSDSLFRHAADGSEQRFGFLFRQDRRRLIKDQQL